MPGGALHSRRAGARMCPAGSTVVRIVITAQLSKSKGASRIANRETTNDFTDPRSAISDCKTAGGEREGGAPTRPAVTREGCS